MSGSYPCTPPCPCRRLCFRCRSSWCDGVLFWRSSCG
uniref:Uncharacterized protein n=1 Tax=Arundo donax TaxID=35708 RepID=A0A0A9HVU4_ARUDO